MNDAGDSPERARLLGLATDLILREGVIDMSLSAIARGAKQAGVSVLMLVQVSPRQVAND